MSWEPINLGKLGERDKIGPTIGGVGLVYPGKHHVFSGPQESAKTIAAYAIALEEIRHGGRVVLIDFEMGQWDARDRLREMGATDDELDRLPYVEPDTPATQGTVAELLELNPTLVIIDAAAGAYDLQDLDDNSRKDAERFAALYIREARLAEVATIVVDHVVKNAEARGKYAIGSERKTGGADVHLGFDTVVPLKRGGTGRFKITTHKDRHGHLKRGHVADLEIRSDPTTDAIRWTFTAAVTSAGEPGEWRPTHYMERVSRHVEQYPAGLSRTAVYRDAGGKRERLVEAVNFLITDGYLRDDGAHLTVVNAYREESPVPGGSLLVPDPDPDAGSPRFPGSQAVPGPFPDAVPTLVPSVPPPIGGTGNRGNRGQVTATSPDLTPTSPGEVELELVDDDDLARWERLHEMGIDP